MRILQVHNQYFSGLGGEDSVVEQEKLLLRSYGHELHQVFVSTRELEGASAVSLVKAGISATWSSGSYELIKHAISQIVPDIVHVHNTFPLLSPSIFWACSQAQVPAVLTLHNYRYLCANGLLSRDGKHCHDCVGRVPFPALWHRCYSDSFGITSSIAGLQMVHRWLKTFDRKIDAYIVLTEFAKAIFIQGGFPKDRIHVKGNFIANLPPVSHLKNRDKAMVFVGAIDETKGIDLLLHAWNQKKFRDWKLLIVGSGRAQERLKLQFSHPSIEWMGKLKNKEVIDLLRRSRFLVLPSRVYEGFPMAVVEAFACGTPIIAPAHGPFPEILAAYEDGLLMPELTVEMLKNILEHAALMDDSNWLAISKNIYQKAGTQFGAECNYRKLLTIYRFAMSPTSIANADLQSA